MKLLGLDIESTGLDVDYDGVVEFGAALFDTENKTYLRLYSEFVVDEKAKIFVESKEDPFINPYKECQRVSRITLEMVEKFGLSYSVISDEIVELFDSCDYVLSSNGTNFDHPLLNNFMERGDVKLPERQWIDLITDIEFPEDCTYRNLLYLAAYHGFINPFPHRALFDSLTMIKITNNYDYDRMIEVAKSPFIKLIAKVSFDNKELAKDEGFRWDPEKKIWHKEIKEILLDYGWVNKLKFEVDVEENNQ